MFQIYFCADYALFRFKEKKIWPIFFKAFIKTEFYNNEYHHCKMKKQKGIISYTK